MVRIQLHCPSKNKTVDGFIIGGAFPKLDQILPGVRIALDIKYAALYNTEAKPINEPSLLQEHQRVLVAASANEIILPDSPREWVLYDGEEGDDVDPNAESYGIEWDDLCDRDKCLHITSLNERKPTTRNKMRITRPYKSVQDDIDALDSAPSLPLTTSDHETTIEKCWGITIEHFLPTPMKPAAAKFSSRSCDPDTLASLSILASFTHGQSRLALDVLEEAIALRTQEDQGEDKDPALQKDDILTAITIVYERAEVIPAKIIKGKGTKAKGQGKKRASKGGRKSLGASSS